MNKKAYPFIYKGVIPPGQRHDRDSGVDMHFEFLSSESKKDLVKDLQGGHTIVIPSEKGEPEKSINWKDLDDVDRMQLELHIKGNPSHITKKYNKETKKIDELRNSKAVKKAHKIIRTFFKLLD